MVLEFLLYLNQPAREVLSYVYKSNYLVRENIEFCKSNRDLFGYANFGNKFVICTENIKRSGYDPKHYVSETVIHEAVHVAHLCNGYRSFGISLKDMPMPLEKIRNVKDSLKSSTAKYNMEHEAYWMEDKPEKVKYVIKKYCL